ncbi:hypothetical protein Mame01_53170 [Microbispora amethystogenes]|nr:hypothetical protein Mame01_53170 [Microbispora amethystogenes]
MGGRAFLLRPGLRPPVPPRMRRLPALTGWDGTPVLHLDDAVSAHQACRKPLRPGEKSRLDVTGDISNVGSRVGTVCGASQTQPRQG